MVSRGGNPGFSGRGWKSLIFEGAVWERAEVIGRSEKHNGFTESDGSSEFNEIRFKGKFAKG